MTIARSKRVLLQVLLSIRISWDNSQTQALSGTLLQSLLSNTLPDR